MGTKGEEFCTKKLEIPQIAENAENIFIYVTQFLTKYWRAKDAVKHEVQIGDFGAGVGGAGAGARAA